MNTKTLLLGAVAAIALASPASASHFQGWYVGLEGGANWIDPAAFTTTIPATTFLATAQTNSPGWALLGTVGYAFPASSWRVELEGGYRWNDLLTYSSSGGATLTATNDTLDEFSLMANVLYDFPLMPTLDLSIGAGLGADEVKFKSALIGFNDSTWSFAYQGIVGLSYTVSPGIDVMVNYRLLIVTETALVDVASGGPPTITLDDVTKHTLTIGLHFDLAPP